MSPQPKLLILDPNIHFSRLLTKKLTDVGCTVAVENNATEALPAIERYRPDIILLELEFKTSSGFEICQEIKSTPKFQDIPVLFHGSYATHHTVLQSIQVGATSFIVKPSSRDTLVRKLNEVAGKLGWGELFHTDSAERFGFTSKSIQGAEKLEQSQVVFSSDMDPTAKLKALLENANEVRAMPFAVARTLEVTQDSRSGAQELGKVIESDAALATKVLARANSVAFGGQKTIGSVKDAIVRLGFRQTRELVLSVSIIRNFGAETNSLGFQRGAFWEHSLAVGMIARALAQQSQIVDPDMAFVSGLVHDLGKLIFDEYMSSNYESAIEMAGKKSCSLREAEEKTFGINHMDVGAALLTKWRFPDVMVKVATLHHSANMIPKIKDNDIRSMVGLIHIANAMAKAYQWGNSGDEMVYPIRDDLLHTLNFTQSLPQRFCDDVKHAIADFRNFLGIPPSDSASKHTDDFAEQVVISLAASKPILDTHEIFLSNDWGFEHQSFTDIDQLRGVENVDQAIAIIDAHDTLIHRQQYDPLLSNPNAQKVILLLDRSSRDKQAQAVEWPTDKVITLETPINGRKLLTAISQLCRA